MKPFAESCEQNKTPILNVLQHYFDKFETVLEIGSGTGQHAVFFSNAFPQLTWYTSDQLDYHSGIQLWLDDAESRNIRGPLLLDVNQPVWPVQEVDGIFSANTVHIMDWNSVENMFAGIGRLLKAQGNFCLYGPFNYAGRFTSESNAKFDHWLKQRDPQSGIRDFETLQNLAEKAGLALIDDCDMPANNRILVWRKSEI